MALFNIFGRKTGRDEEPTGLRNALQALEDRVYALERDQKGVRTEWESQYDSFRRLLAKLNKRVQREENPKADSSGGLPQVMNPLARSLLDAAHVHGQPAQHRLDHQRDR